jgi:hypothetical protein
MPIAELVRKIKDDKGTLKAESSQAYAVTQKFRNDLGKHCGSSLQAASIATQVDDAVMKYFESLLAGETDALSKWEVDCAPIKEAIKKILPETTNASTVRALESSLNELAVVAESALEKSLEAQNGITHTQSLETKTKKTPAEQKAEQDETNKKAAEKAKETADIINFKKAHGLEGHFYTTPELPPKDINDKSDLSSGGPAWQQDVLPNGLSQRKDGEGKPIKDAPVLNVSRDKEGGIRITAIGGSFEKRCKEMAIACRVSGIKQMEYSHPNPQYLTLGEIKTMVNEAGKMGYSSACMQGITSMPEFNQNPQAAAISKYLLNMKESEQNYDVNNHSNSLLKLQKRVDEADRKPDQAAAAAEWKTIEKDVVALKNQRVPDHKTDTDRQKACDDLLERVENGILRSATQLAEQSAEQLKTKIKSVSADMSGTSPDSKARDTLMESMKELAQLHESFNDNTAGFDSATIAKLSDKYGEIAPAAMKLLVEQLENDLSNNIANSTGSLSLDKIKDDYAVLSKAMNTLNETLQTKNLGLMKDEFALEQKIKEQIEKMAIVSVLNEINKVSANGDSNTVTATCITLAEQLEGLAKPDSNHTQESLDKIKEGGIALFKVADQLPSAAKDKGPLMLAIARIEENIKTIEDKMVKSMPSIK